MTPPTPPLVSPSRSAAGSSTFSAHLNYGTLLFNTLGYDKEMVPQFLVVWGEVGVNKDIMTFRNGHWDSPTGFSQTSYYSVSSCCSCSFVVSSQVLIQPFWAPPILSFRSIWMYLFSSSSLCGCRHRFSVCFLSRQVHIFFLSRVLALTKQWRMLRLIWSECFQKLHHSLDHKCAENGVISLFYRYFTLSSSDCKQCNKKVNLFNQDSQSSIAGSQSVY